MPRFRETPQVFAHRWSAHPRAMLNGCRLHRGVVVFIGALPRNKTCLAQAHGIVIWWSRASGHFNSTPFLRSTPPRGRSAPTPPPPPPLHRCRVRRTEVRLTHSSCASQKSGHLARRPRFEQGHSMLARLASPREKRSSYHERLDGSTRAGHRPTLPHRYQTEAREELRH